MEVVEWEGLLSRGYQPVTGDILVVSTRGGDNPNGQLWLASSG